MELIDKAITKKLLMSILFTIFLPAGILAIIFGATKGMTALLIVGIVMTVLGFYGSPILWINFGELKRLRMILNLILVENIYSAQEIAEHISSNVETVNSDINKLIIKGFLKGYLFKEGYLQLNRNKKQKMEDVKKYKCPNCGGFMEYNGIDYTCEYCGNVVKDLPNQQ